MSTLHRDAAVSSREDKKPDIILEYNQTKGGVDNLDKVTGTYTCQRRTARWRMVVFHNILDVSAYNAFVLWMAINPGWNAQKTLKRRLFLEELGRALTTPHIERRTRIPRAPASADLMREVQAQSSSRPAGPPPPGYPSQPPPYPGPPQTGHLPPLPEYQAKPPAYNVNAM